ncbi:MAG: hypothetical protein EWV53_01510 [Microcystis panniformis Mp_MB_F_20051200_S9]|uniref:Uncharacterized protein n=1 Tax=Microcystis panniformis Mp_MB_F_20051200_S9 TaxID=2486223 RepID=A0A552QAD9_9CHRO|nr:MAG: hypothetical protein EWV87_22680 [Microcystis panniformis Mp_GB_SS_20050300_S99]TRV53249.1 MAG: hypothetical protein EWV43_00315 [Microcystis panniformis Mp_MB_F_20080800_S26D]TRV54615.1 MAG: hypothetical protein EWV42_03765 [Microcystis panniformis Mp_GB_SS_20050300_S99D]TRV61300.1 MAG: hypothetical protein EWV69_08065 [Microcystis panniformis Mp_MB_F_20080800_S26]TRV66180.1 MAG: hypothetical protein EWV53_01510 [Microcystis panniformis Mp_MB_F_20051200_S9]TRV67871.1 MAG: hypothetical
MKKYLPQQPSARISEKRAIQLNFAAVIIGDAKVLMIRSNFRFLSLQFRNFSISLELGFS